MPSRLVRSSICAALLWALGAGDCLGQTDDLPVRSDVEAAHSDAPAPPPRPRRFPVRPREYRASPAERSRQFALTAFCTAYFFVLGGMVGSFVNVVAWRLPRGENIFWPGSRCPKCGVPIRLSDNIPIVSWLWLRGRCRACSQPISPRYAVVEAAMASLFLGLAWWELLSGGGNLPVRTPNPRTGILWILWETQWDLLGIYAYHCCLISVVATIVLIALDGTRVPRRLLAFALGVGWAAPLALPWLRPAPFWFPWDDAPQLPGWLRVALDAAAGTAAGWTMAAMVGRISPDRRQLPPHLPDAPARTDVGLVELDEGDLAVEAAHNASPPSAAAEVVECAWPAQAPRAGANRRAAAQAVLICAGVYLGWQAGLTVGLFAAAGLLAATVLGRVWPFLRRIPVAVHGAAAILALLAGWRWLFEAIAAG